MNDDVERILLSEEQIRAAIQRIAHAVEQEFRGSELTVISVLKGSCIFTADLIRALPLPLELSFVVATSYRDGTVPGALELKLLPSAGELRGRRVLLVDDILDSGRTLTLVRAALMERGVIDVKTCVLLDKPSRRAVDLEADFVGFPIDDVFVVGYGLDHAGRYRNLPYVGHLKSEVLSPSAG